MNSSWMSYGGEHEPTPAELEQLARMRAEMAGPPENIVGVAWPFTAVLARTDEAAVVVHGAEVFATGLAFRLTALVRRGGARALDPSGFMGRMGHRGRPGVSVSGSLRFGVRYADGRTVDTLEQAGGPFGRPGDPAAPRLRPRGGHGSEGSWAQDLFLRPLPPDGPLDLFCAWPDFGIAESRASIDLSGVTAAAAGAIELWPLEPEPVWQPPSAPRLGEPGAGFFRPILDDDNS